MTRLRVAVIGLGWWSSSVHLPALTVNPAAEVVAVCDPSPERCQRAAASFAIKESFADVDDLLAAGVADAVVVATPHSTHAPIVTGCLQAGLHVLVEKPMATTAEQAWALVEVAARAGRRLSVGLTYQYAATAARIQDTVRTGLGELVGVNAEFSSATLPLFSATQPADASADPATARGTTYSDPATGGGQAHTQLTHLLGALLWAAGDQAAEVAAFMDNRGLAVDVVDALAFRLAAGALGVASSTGTTPPSAPPRHRLRFHGTRGMLEWDMLRAAASIFTDRGVEYLEPPPHLPPYPRADVTGAFVRMLTDGGPNHAPADLAAASVALIEAAHTAARTREVVAVAQGPLTSDDAGPVPAG